MKTAMNKVETEIKKERKTSETLSVPFCGYTRWGAINKLAGLLAMGVVLSAAVPALGRPGLHVVRSPVINGSELLAAAAIAHNDIWAVGVVRDISGTASTLAEHFDGTSWSVVPTPVVNDPLVAVAGSASNDVWAVGSQTNVVIRQPRLSRTGTARAGASSRARICRRIVS